MRSQQTVPPAKRDAVQTASNPEPAMQKLLTSRQKLLLLPSQRATRTTESLTSSFFHVSVRDPFQMDRCSHSVSLHKSVQFVKGTSIRILRERLSNNASINILCYLIPLS